MIDGDRLRLRPLALDDVDDIALLAGDRRIAATTQMIPHPYERMHAEAWIRSLSAPDTRSVAFAVARRGDGALVGTVGLSMDASRSLGSLGYWIGVPYWNQGFATEAAGLMLAYGFDALALEAISAIHLARNPASGRVMQKLGMRHIGSSIDLVRGELEAVERYRIERHEFADPKGLER
jgi:RimJ/RimL family protein N-acetyltransferase